MLLKDLWTISINLKRILCETASQCSSFKIGVIWHDFLDKVTTRAAACVLYVLKTRYLILRETVKESIPVIGPWCDNCMYNLFSSTLIQIFPYSANISDMMIWNDDTRTMLEIWGFKVIVGWNITPELRACDEGVICESPIVINGLIIADAIQIKETLFFRRSSFVSSICESLEYISPAL